MAEQRRRARKGGGGAGRGAGGEEQSRADGGAAGARSEQGHDAARAGRTTAAGRLPGLPRAPPRSISARGHGPCSSALPLPPSPRQGPCSSTPAAVRRMRPRRGRGLAAAAGAEAMARRHPAGCSARRPDPGSRAASAADLRRPRFSPLSGGLELSPRRPSPAPLVLPPLLVPAVAAELQLRRAPATAAGRACASSAAGGGAAAAGGGHGTRGAWPGSSSRWRARRRRRPVCGGHGRAERLGAARAEARWGRRRHRGRRRLV